MKPLGPTKLTQSKTQIQRSSKSVDFKLQIQRGRRTSRYKSESPPQRVFSSPLLRPLPFNHLSKKPESEITFFTHSLSLFKNPPFTPPINEPFFVPDRFGCVSGDFSVKNAWKMTPVKDPVGARSQISENSNPNLATPKQKSGSSKSPLVKSVKVKKSVQKNLNLVISPRNKIQERKFIVARKKSKAVATDDSAKNVFCKCKEKAKGGNPKKCPCIAYQNLRVSQEEFFKNLRSEESKQDYEVAVNHKDEEPQMDRNVETEDRNEYNKSVEGDGSPPNHDLTDDEFKILGELGCSTIKRRRAKVLEEARQSVPEPGSGRVKHLVQAFERLLTIPRSKDSEEGGEEGVEEGHEKVMKWALPLPGLQPPSAPETRSSLSSFTPSDLLFTSDNFGIDLRVSSSLDSTRRGCLTSRSSFGGGRRSRRNSSDSCTTGGSKWKKKQQLKATRQQPFKLRTEQRGRSKEEEFIKKVQEMCLEDEKLRIPIAQGLPWTTDEPECLVKPPVKESTRPIDLKLHSDARAVERAEFDHHVQEKLSLIEQYKMERERQQKMAEEDEIRRLRRELVPKAQPMPYFDRPFVPQRSSKHPTIPKEPRFHDPQHKKVKCMLWSDINIFAHQH